MITHLQLHLSFALELSLVIFFYLMPVNILVKIGITHVNSTLPSVCLNIFLFKHWHSAGSILNIMRIYICMCKLNKIFLSFLSFFPIILSFFSITLLFNNFVYLDQVHCIYSTKRTLHYLFCYVRLPSICYILVRMFTFFGLLVLYVFIW